VEGMVINRCAPVGYCALENADCSLYSRLDDL